MRFLNDLVRGLLPSLSDEGLLTILSLAKMRHIGKGTRFVHEGEIPKNFYVINSGIARSFLIDKKGKELTKTLYVSTVFCGPLTALIQREPCLFNFDCLTDCEIVEFDYSRMVELTKKNHELSLLHAKIVENIYIRNDLRISDLAYLDATERYLKLREQIHDIDNLIPQYYIASYLNITPTQLSRIRKKLFSQ